MNKAIILYAALIAMLALLLYSIWMRLAHQPAMYNLFVITLIVNLVFMVTAIYEVTRSQKINRSEKTMWVVGFIFLTSITGLVYVFSARKRIL